LNTWRRSPALVAITASWFQSKTEDFMMGFLAVSVANKPAPRQESVNQVRRDIFMGISNTPYPIFTEIPKQAVRENHF
jgi:hypothetical protein